MPTRSTAPRAVRPRARRLNDLQAAMLLRYAAGTEQEYVQLGKSSARARGLWKRGLLFVAEEVEGVGIRYDITEEGRMLALRLAGARTTESSESSETHREGGSHVQHVQSA